MPAPTQADRDAVTIRCHYCARPIVGEIAYFEHLQKTHRYPAEDAGSSAADAALSALAQQDPEWPTYLRLQDKFRPYF